MSAHLRPLSIKCDEQGCTRGARVELRNTYNAPLGKFCARHAKLRLREVLRNEQQRAS